MKYYLYTEIEGVKQYVRRIRIAASGRVAVTMLCVYKPKAHDFGNLNRATEILNRLGIGYAIETSK